MSMAKLLRPPPLVIEIMLPHASLAMALNSSISVITSSYILLMSW